MASGWDDPAVPPQQHALATRELAAWRSGRAHGPFDAFRACAQRIVFTRDQPRIVDVGCGAGVWLEVFREQWPRCRVLGMDASAAMVRFARLTYAAWGRVSYAQGDARKLAMLDDGVVDLLFHGCCLIHIPPTEWADTLAEAARVIDPYGYVLTSKTPIAQTRSRRTSHEFYGTRFVEWSATRAQWAEAYTAAGLVPVWEEEWNESSDPRLVTTLFQRRA